MKRVVNRVGAFFLLTAVLATSFFFISARRAYAVTRTWDGGGTDGTCGGGAGDGNKWSCAANWSGDTAPTASDLAAFDGTSTKNATIDANINVGGITMNSGYTGVITQATGVTVTVGSQNFVTSAGTFTGGNSAITISGALTVSGGTFTSTTGTLTLTGNFTVSSGSFDPSTGTMTATGGTSTWNVATTETVNNMTVAKNNAASLFISSGDTIVVLGTLTLTDGYLETGTIDTRGNTTQASTFDGWDTIIDFGDNSVSQTYTINGGVAPNIRLDAAADASDSIVYGAAATIRIFTVTSGFSGTIPISNPSNFAMTFLTWSQSGGTFNGSSFSTMNITGATLTIGSAATFNAPTTVTASGTGVSIDVNSTQTFTNLSVSSTVGTTIGSGDTLITTGTFTMGSSSVNGGTVDARGNVVQNSGSGAGSTIIDFGDNAVVQTYTINGGTGPTLRLDSASDANDSLVFAAAGGLFSLTTTAGFSGTIPISNASNFAMSFNNWSQSAGDFTANYCSGTCSTMNLGGGTTTFTIVSPATFTAPTTVAVSSTGMTFDVNSSQTFNNLSTSTSVALNIASGDTIVTNGTFTMAAGSLNGGTLNANGNIVQNASSAAGSTTLNFANNASSQTYTINGGSGPIVTLDSASDASDSIIYAAAGAFTMNVTSGFSGTIPISNASNFAMSFPSWTQQAGTFNGSSFSTMNITTSGMTIGSAATFNAPTTINTTGAGQTWDVNVTQTINNLAVNHTVQLVITSGDTIVVAGNLTLTNGQVNTGSVQLQGNLTETAGTISSPLTFTGSATQTVTLSNTSSIDGDVTVNKTGGQVNMANALVLNATNQDLTLTSGTFAIKGFNLTVNGTSGTFVVQSGGVFERYGAETLTLNASNPTLQTGSTVRFTGDGDAAGDTYTVTTMTTTYYNLQISSTDGTTDTFQLGAALDVNGSLTNSGTFTTTGSNYQINVAVDWTNTGTFTPNSGTVIFDGTNQTISGTTTFNAFTKTVASAATLTFPASVTQTFSGTLTLQGGSAVNRLSIRSSSSGVAASINPSGTRSVQYLDVKDNTNANVTTISCLTGCFDSGNNVNWLFPGISVGTISGNTTEAGGTATFSVVLVTQPTSNVDIPVSSNDTTEGTIVVSTLTFTNGNWATPQVVTVTGVNDFLDDGDIAYSIVLGTTTSSDPDYNSLNPSDVSVTNTDNDTSGTTVSTISGDTTEFGGTATFTVVLTAQPTADVTIPLASSDTSEGTIAVASLTFTSGNWSSVQTVTVTGADDLLDDNNIAYSIVLSAITSGDGNYNGQNPADVSVLNLDNDVTGVAGISDTMTDQAPGAVSSHTIGWTSSVQNLAGTTITVVFASADFSFSAPATWQTSDFTFSDTNHAATAPLAVGAAPSCTASDNYIVTVDDTTETFVITLCSGWVANTASTSSTFVVYGTTALGTGTITNGADVDSSQYTITYSSLSNPSATGASIIETNADVVIVATIREKLTFSNNDSTIGFGALTAFNTFWATSDTNGQTTDTAAHSLTASTNAIGGYTITMFGPLLTSGANSIDSIGATLTTPDAAGADEEFGVRFVVSGSGSGAVDANYSSASQYAYDAVSSADTIASASAPTLSNTYQAHYLANVDSGTPAGNYSTTIYFVATGNF